MAEELPILAQTLKERLEWYLLNHPNKVNASASQITAHMNRIYVEYKQIYFWHLVPVVQTILKEILEKPETEIVKDEQLEEQLHVANPASEMMSQLYKKDSPDQALPTAANVATVATTSIMGTGEGTQGTKLFVAKNGTAQPKHTSQRTAAAVAGKSRAAKRKAVNCKATMLNLPKRATLKMRNFHHVGGLSNLLDNLRQLIKKPVDYASMSILIHGARGCGKTLLARAIAGELGLPIIEQCGYETIDCVMSAFERAQEVAPSVLLVSHIDGISNGIQTAMNRFRAMQLLKSIQQLKATNKELMTKVVLIGTTSRYTDLDSALVSGCGFVHKLEIPIPSQAERAEILEVLCREFYVSLDLKFAKLAQRTPGFNGRDLNTLVVTAKSYFDLRMKAKSSLPCSLPKFSFPFFGTSHSSSHFTPNALNNKDPTPTVFNSTDCLNSEDFERALHTVKASCIRADAISVPNVTWDDIGSLRDVREELELAILAHTKYPKEVKLLGLATPSAVLLCGPPGVGKTLLAKAFANESGMSFISVKGPELIEMNVGKSEHTVRSIFERARNSAPCIIFFDEFDALCATRTSASSNQNNSSPRIVNQLLTMMDDVEEREGLFVLAATNRADIIDPAILRPGRFDKKIYIGLPKREDRVDIIKAVTKNSTQPVLASDVDINELADRTDGYSGADLAGLVKQAAELALKEYIALKVTPLCYSLCVRRNHFERALAKIGPSVTEKERKEYEKLCSKYMQKVDIIADNQATGDGPGNAAEIIH